MTNQKPYTKIFGLGVNPWQYEIFGCIIFYLLFILCIHLSILNNPFIYIGFAFLSCGLSFLAIGIYSPINVYRKYRSVNFDVELYDEYFNNYEW